MAQLQLDLLVRLFVGIVAEVDVGGGSVVDHRDGDAATPLAVEVSPIELEGGGFP